MKGKALMLLMALAVLTATFAGCKEKAPDIPALPGDQSGMGNSNGNITNGGILAFQDGILYFSNEGDHLSIYKLDEDRRQQTNTAEQGFFLLSMRCRGLDILHQRNRGQKDL
jgi:hypothetical protein